MSEGKPYILVPGDCLEVLKTMTDSSVDSIVTDPPYGLSKKPDMTEVMHHWLAGDDYQHKGAGFMGKSWDSFVPGPAVWTECLRVLKPGGHLLCFFGARTYDMGCLAIRLAGFEIRDQIAWLYGSGFPKSRNVGREVESFDGWGTALKPAQEPIVVARKPLDGTVAANVQAHSTGAINIDGCRVGTGGGDKTSGGCAGTSALHGGGIQKRSMVDFSTGRWPANVVHDGSDEVLGGFPDSKGQQGDVKGTEPSRTGGEGTNCYGEYGRVPAAKRSDGSGSAARFFYCAKASKKDRGDGNKHPTVKPTALMRWLVRLVTPPGGLVLDPYMGSGSTGCAAMAEGFHFVGIEMEQEYIEIAEARISHYHEQAGSDPWQ